MQDFQIAMMHLVTKITDSLFFVDFLFSDKTQKKNKPFFVGLSNCDFGFSLLCFVGEVFWACRFSSPDHKSETLSLFS